ncbi:MAG: hypothetical protein HY064_14905 [Bacteroidetes bacterium]|nr:hypothetical protein [Bacteroidota bacterium]
MRTGSFLCFILLIALLIHSCDPGTGEQGKTGAAKKNPLEKTMDTVAQRSIPFKKDSSVARKEVPLKDAIGCFYLLDDKENSLNDTAGLASWENSILNHVEHFGLGENIFSHHGGGPNGSEWNANAGDVLVILTSELFLTQPEFIIQLNGKTWTPKNLSWKNSKIKNGSLSWFILPASAWYPRLKTIRKTDYKDLYGDTASTGISYLAPLNTGKIIRIDFSVNMNSSSNTNTAILQRGYIHNAEGE